MLLSHEQQYEAAWADLRLRGRTLLIVFVAAILSLPLLILGASTILPVNVALAMILFGAIVVLGALLNRSAFTCPRCGKWFFLANPLARSCMHCDLPIGAPYKAGQLSG